jgi:hypothetical protein
LFSDPEELEISKKDKYTFNWNAFRARENEGMYIVDLALRVEPTPCSGASCERTISM